MEDLHKLRDAYNDALGIYDMFTNMASISQIMSLGDFKQQMKTTLDKWGNVLDITLARYPALCKKRWVALSRPIFCFTVND